MTRDGFIKWHSARGPALRMVRHLFGLPLYLEGRCCENPKSARGPKQYKSSPINNMLVNRSNLLLYHFSGTSLLYLASFYRKKSFEKKIAREMLIEQIIEF